MAEELESLRASFNRSLRVEGKADRTLVLYGQSITFFSQWLAKRGQPADLSSLDRDTVLQWLDFLRSRGLSTWGSRPRSSISAKVKAQVRRRDKVCQLQYPGCTQRIEEMDHIEGLAAQGIPRTPVLNAKEIQGGCQHCHAIKTQQQIAEGRDRARQQRGGLSRRQRDHEPHPGAL